MEKASDPALFVFLEARSYSVTQVDSEFITILRKQTEHHTHALIALCPWFWMWCDLLPQTLATKTSPWLGYKIGSLSPLPQRQC